MMSLFQCLYLCFQSLLPRTCFFCGVLFEEEEPSPSLSAYSASSGFSADGDLPVTSSSCAFSTVFWDELPSSETSFIPSPLFGDGGGEWASFFTSWISPLWVHCGIVVSYSPFSCLTRLSPFVNRVHLLPNKYYCLCIIKESFSVSDTLFGLQRVVLNYSRYG